MPVRVRLSIKLLLVSATVAAITAGLLASNAGATADPILVAAGDISTCGGSGDEATAKLLDGIFAGGAVGRVATLGDNVYQDGSPSQYSSCYAPTWGRHKSRTLPVPGNHDYHTTNAAGYFGYFGAAAGDPHRGYYSVNLGAWHIIVLNSNCSHIGGCQVGSAQEKWLRSDLAAHPAHCTLAMWHHPRFSSGPNGSTSDVQPLWQALYDAHADVVVNGHDHDYERFAPQTPSGQRDLTRGIREFVVGTGGASHYGITHTIANSEVHNTSTFGVLKLTLHATSYTWQFVPEAGKTFADAGTGTCH